MIDFEMIEKIQEWGIDVEREYHKKKAHQGIIGINDDIINDDIITELGVYEIFCEYKEYLVSNIDSYDEFLKVLDKNPVYVGDFIIYTKFKIYHEEANCLISLSEYLGDEFEEYLKDNNIELYNWQISDMEEFFEQYGIEVY